MATRTVAVEMMTSILLGFNIISFSCFVLLSGIMEGHHEPVGLAWFFLVGFCGWYEERQSR